jgi:glucose-6-phosphate dehydrogenase assembly protein OpcA
MTVAVTASIITLLKQDTTLATFLGGANVFKAKMIAPSKYPSVTVRITGDASKQRVGYNISKHRDNNATCQVDVWVKTTGEDADRIADRIDEILNGDAPPSYTYGWVKQSQTPLYEDDTRTFHVSLRYGYKYKLNDS